MTLEEAAGRDLPERLLEAHELDRGLERQVRLLEERQEPVRGVEQVQVRLDARHRQARPGGDLLVALRELVLDRPETPPDRETRVRPPLLADDAARQDHGTR